MITLLLWLLLHIRVVDDVLPPPFVPAPHLRFLDERHGVIPPMPLFQIELFMQIPI